MAPPSPTARFLKSYWVVLIWGASSALVVRGYLQQASRSGVRHYARDNRVFTITPIASATGSRVQPPKVSP